MAKPSHWLQSCHEKIINIPIILTKLPKLTYIPDCLKTLKTLGNFKRCQRFLPGKFVKRFCYLDNGHILSFLPLVQNYGPACQNSRYWRYLWLSMIDKADDVDDNLILTLITDSFIENLYKLSDIAESHYYTVYRFSYCFITISYITYFIISITPEMIFVTSITSSACEKLLPLG